MGGWRRFRHAAERCCSSTLLDAPACAHAIQRSQPSDSAGSRIKAVKMLATSPVTAYQPNERSARLMEKKRLK